MYLNLDEFTNAMSIISENYYMKKTIFFDTRDVR